MLKEEMDETPYRGSRCCRILGNPVAYKIVQALGRQRRTPSELAADLGMPLTNISQTLGKLRLADLVRYQTRRANKVYWLKDEGILDILDSLEQMIERMRRKRK